MIISIDERKNNTPNDIFFFFRSQNERTNHELFFCPCTFLFSFDSNDLIKNIMLKRQSDFFQSNIKNRFKKIKRHT